MINELSCYIIILCDYIDDNAQIIPNPSALLIAITSFSLSRVFVLYGGSNKWLKQVCATGNLEM